MLNGVACIELNNSPQNGFPEIDIVFVHGISSDALSAWQTTAGDIWPTWLRQTVRNCRVALLNYPAPALFHKKESSVSIRERGRNLADFLPSIGVGRRPTIFICHSLGGLVVKEVLRSSVENGCSVELAANTIGLVYLATPHAGAEIASLASIVGSQLTVELSISAPYLLELRDWFSTYANDRRLFVSGYAETQTYRGALVVSRESSDPMVRGCNCIPIDGDHSSISKPSSPSSDIYLRIQRDITKAIEGYERMTGNQLVAIDDILALPSLTNNMFFDVLNLLNRELSNGSQKGIVISNPCGGSRPSCIIVSQHPSVIALVRPLQDRFPDRFRVEEGILGEFTEEEEAPHLPSIGQGGGSKKHLESVDGLANAIADYVADQVIFDVKVSTFWKDDAEVHFVAALHTLESALKVSIERVLNGASPKVDERRSSSKRLRMLMSKIEDIAMVDQSETIAESIRCIYRENKFSFRVFSERKAKRDEIDYSTVLSLRSAQVKRVVHSRDAFVFCASVEKNEESAIEKWAKANTHVMWATTKIESDKPHVGSKVSVHGSDVDSFTVESVDQTVFFPMVDKVTSLKSVMVLSGGSIERGSSGSTVFRQDGRPFAMVIGRTFRDGECKALAVTIDEVVNQTEKASSSLRHYFDFNKELDSGSVEGGSE